MISKQPGNTQKRTHGRVDDPRITNIETAIRQIQASLADLTRAMVSLARVEEKLAASHETSSRLQKDITNLQAKVVELTTANAAQNAQAAAEQEKSRWIERIIWAGLTVLMAYFGANLKEGALSDEAEEKRDAREIRSEK